MRLKSLRLRGLSVAFPREVHVDFAALPPGLVALVGPNGAGKSTLLEASGPLTLYRESPYYQRSFAAQVAPGVRDAFSELVFEVSGIDYRVRVQADPQFNAGRGKTEAYLYRHDNDPSAPAWDPLAGPNLRDVDEQLARILPPKDLFYASAFAAQGGGGSFFELAPRERKAMFTRLLGIEHLQALSEASRAEGQRVTGALEAARTTLVAAEARATRAGELAVALNEVAEELTAHAQWVAVATARETVVQAALVEAREALARGKAEAAAAEEAAARHATERRQRQARVADLEAALARAAATIAEAATIEAAAAELEELDRQLASARQSEREMADALRPVQEAFVAAKAALEQLGKDCLAQTREHVAAKAAAARVEAEERKRQHAAAEAAAALAQVETELAAGHDATEALEQAARAEAEATLARGRLEARREELAPRTRLLDEVPGVPECATCPLTADARRARDALRALDLELAEVPAADGAPAADRLAAHRRKLRDLAAERETRRTAHTEAQRAVEALEADRQLADREAALAEAARRTTAALEAKQTEVDQLRAEGKRRQAALDAVRGQITTTEAQRARVAATAARLPEIAAARARHQETQEALDRARQDLAALDAAPQPPTVDLVPYEVAVQRADDDLRLAVDDRQAAEAAQRAAATTRARLEGERQALGDPAADVARLRGELDTLTADAGDWTLLAKALGRDGVQALEIDAAGPRVSAIANALLADCFGGRFQLRIITTAPKQDGGTKEVFEVQVLDNLAGRVTEKGSGGEMVPIEEALRIAIALYLLETSEAQVATLWRDETTGALDEETAGAYVAMLRRALARGGFRHLLFISHDRRVWEQADAVLWVGGGQVRVEMGPVIGTTTPTMEEQAV